MDADVVLHRLAAFEASFAVGNVAMISSPMVLITVP